MTRTQNKHDAYARVSVMQVNATSSAVKLIRMNDDDTETEGEEVWIPRSLLSHSAESYLDRAGFNAPVSVEIRKWKLVQLGWV